MRATLTAAEMRAQLDAERAISATLLSTLKEARRCIAWCRKNHSNIQSGEGAPIEIFIDEVIAKAENRV